MLERRAVVVLIIIAGVVAAVVFTAYLGTTAGTNSSGGNLPNPYVNKAYAFSVQYPQGWKGYENYKIGNTTSAVTFFGTNSSISIIAQPISPSQTLASLDSASKQATLGNHNGYTMILRSEGTGIVSHVAASVRIWLRESPQGSYQEETFHLIYRGYVYSIGFISRADTYDADVATFNHFLGTFTFY